MTEAASVYGILGYPATHSLSPAMHRAAFASLAMNAQYKIFEVRPEDLDSFFEAARLTIHGFNITIPYKEQALPLLDYVSPDARAIGAVNTVKVRARRLEGFNTDGQGFILDLEEKGFRSKGARVCVVGAGGASRGVCFFLGKAEAAEVAVFNRDARKAEHLVGHLKEQFPRTNFRHASSVDGLGIEEAGLLVNTTSLGMHAGDPLPVEERFLRKGLFVYDLVYSPGETKLLRAAADRGCRTADGLGMLLHQGMLAFEIWTGIRPPREPMEKALRQAAKAD